MVSIKISVTQPCAEVLHAYGITPDTYCPAYGGESVGLDLYNVGPELTIPSLKKWQVLGEDPVLVSTGVKIIVPKGYVAFIKERSSIIKTSLKIRAGVIDPGYTGEIFVNFVNVGEKDITVPLGVKLPAQLVVVKSESNYQVINNLEFLDLTKDSERKEGSVGSTQDTGAGD